MRCVWSRNPAAVARHWRSRHGIRVQRQGQVHAQQQQQRQHALSDLSTWLQARGGFCHPALRLVDAAPSSGVRGIIAAAEVTLTELEASGPLLVVPERLVLGSARALEALTAAAGRGAAEDAAAALPDATLAAAALAVEMADPVSDWRPYLATLPHMPPCPWLQTGCATAAGVDDGTSLARIVSARGLSAVAGWGDAAAAAAADADAAAAAGAALLGGHLGVSAAELRTALGHVASRSLASGGRAGLVPGVDLINHDARARAPMLTLRDDDSLAITVVPILGVRVCCW